MVRKSNSRLIRLRRSVLALTILWTAASATALLWILARERREVSAVARGYAQAAFEKDVAYRQWAAERGGIYVPVSEETPPNPYPAHLDERDVSTPSGRSLTLFNPAYMTRQVHELGMERYGLRGHITSLNPIRPENAPDPWEAEALRTLDSGIAEVTSVEEIDGATYMRLMRPLFIDESCLQCHADQDYVVGSLGGGISQTVPMAPLWAIARPTMLSTSLGFGFLWLLGLAGLRGATLRLGESLRERDLAEEKLRRSNEELKAFTDSVSHDLRAPLRAIDGFAELILDEHADQLDQEGARLLNVVRENTGLMGTLIKDLLELSRLGRQALEPRKLNMKELVEEVIQDLESQTPDSRREVTLCPLPSARGDHTLIRQVWVNLLSNAVKFSCSRDVSRIQIDGRIEGEGSIYWVKDNGAGFDMASAEKLFNVFERLHSGEEYEGTGVGLSIVKRIVERHGGRVWAEGKVDEGATFWFMIPVSEGVSQRTASE